MLRRMRRACLAMVALGWTAAWLPAESLSISVALPQRQDAGPALSTDDAPRPLHPLELDFACPVILRNESDKPLRLSAGVPHLAEPGVSFRLNLDDGRSLAIRWQPSFEINSFSLHPTLRYWLLQPGESLVLVAHLGNALADDPGKGHWNWDPRKVSGHRGTLVPLFDEQAPGASAPPLLWTGHIEGKGVPVQF